MTTKKIPFNYDINRMLAVDLIAIIHIDDYDTRFLELTLFDDGTPFSVGGCTVTSRFVTISGSYLLSDNVPCEAAGNTITIPIDAAAVQMMACDIKIEVNIVDGEKILTLPFPLWVRVRGSILEAAHVTPESQGTIPELLEKVKEELERVQGYVDEEQVKNIIDGVLSGVTTNVPTLLIDNTVNQQYNPDGHLIWYYIDSDGARHNLFDFTPYLGGTDDYNDLNNKPQISGVTLSGDKTPDELGLQKKLTAGDNVTIDENGVISAEGGSQIVSGVVNANGTITFTDSDGNTFTTTGSSVIGADGVGIADVHIDGGGDLIIETTDGHMENVGHVVGADGQDYVLTNQDKTDIANIVLQLLPTTQGVLYGNTSN